MLVVIKISDLSDVWNPICKDVSPGGSMEMLLKNFGNFV